MTVCSRRPRPPGEASASAVGCQLSARLGECPPRISRRRTGRQRAGRRGEAGPQFRRSEDLDLRAQGEEVPWAWSRDSIGSTARVQPSGSAVPVPASARAAAPVEAGRGSGREPDDRLARVQAGVEVRLVAPPVGGQVEVLGRLRTPRPVRRVRGSGRPGTSAVPAGSRDDVPAARLEHQAVRLQAPVDVGRLLPAAVADVEHPAVPHRVRDRRQMRDLVVRRVPAGRVQVEAASASGRPASRSSARERRTQLELGGGEGRAEPELGGGPGMPGEEQRLRLPGGQPGQPGAVAGEQLVAAGVPGVAVQRHARRVQRLDVAVDGAHRHLQLLGELGGGHPAPGLEQQQDREKTAGLH